MKLRAEHIKKSMPYYFEAYCVEQSFTCLSLTLRMWAWYNLKCKV